MIVGIRIREDWSELARVALHISHSEEIELLYQSHLPYSEFDFIVETDKEVITKLALMFKAKFTPLTFQEIQRLKETIGELHFRRD